MKTLKLLWVAMVCAVFPALAQYPSIGRSISIDPTTYRLLGAATNVLWANSNLIWQVLGRTNLGDSVLAPDTLIIRPVVTNGTLAGATVIPAGSSLVGRLISITGDPSTLPSSNAIPKSYVDTGLTVLTAYVDDRAVNVVTNLAQLLAITQLSDDRHRLTIVLQDTSSDGAMGLWYWDPQLLGSDSATIKKPTVYSPSDPGRWVKFGSSNTILTGFSVVPAGSRLSGRDIVITGDPNTLSSSNAIPKSYADQIGTLGVFYAQQLSTLVVPTLADLVGQTGSVDFYKLAVVLQDTGNDGAAGDWYWDWNSTAAETSVCKRLTARSPSDPGRWFKR